MSRAGTKCYVVLHSSGFYAIFFIYRLLFSKKKLMKILINVNFLAIEIPKNLV